MNFIGKSGFKVLVVLLLVVSSFSFFVFAESSVSSGGGGKAINIIYSSGEEVVWVTSSRSGDQPSYKSITIKHMIKNRAYSFKVGDRLVWVGWTESYSNPDKILVSVNNKEVFVVDKYYKEKSCDKYTGRCPMRSAFQWGEHKSFDSKTVPGLRVTVLVPYKKYTVEDGPFNNSRSITLTSADNITRVNNTVCAQNYAPVCGFDGKTYSNECFALSSGWLVKHSGTCRNETNTSKCEEVRDVPFGGFVTHLVENKKYSFYVDSKEYDVVWKGMEDYKAIVEINNEEFEISSGTPKRIEVGDYEFSVVLFFDDKCGSLFFKMVRIGRIPGLNVISIRLDKGWNLITSPGKVVRFIPGESKVLGFVWLNGKYVTLKTAWRTLGSKFSEYLATHAFWVYSYKDQTLNMVVRSFSVDSIPVKKGWNMIPVIDDFVDKTLEELGSCDFKSAYTWDSGSQQWKKWSLSSRFSKEMVGEGLLVRSGSNCRLAGGTLMPPPFPEENSVKDNFIKVEYGGRYKGDNAPLSVKPYKARIVVVK